MLLARRRLLLLAAGPLLLPPGRSRATPAEVAERIRAITGGGVPQPGRIKLDLPILVENGNAVAMTVRLADGAPSEPRLTDLHVLAEGNPRPDVIHARFGPRSGAPRIATRIRLSTAQTVHALGLFADGSAWIDSLEVLVTISACLDD